MTDDILEALIRLVLYPDSSHVPDLSGQSICQTAYGWIPNTRA